MRVLRVLLVGVFAGGWSWQRGPFGRRRIPVGFVGTLREMGLDGRAVFACTRQVADAIVADQRRLRVFWRDELVNLGVRPQACVWAVERLLPTIGFDGDQLVVSRWRCQSRSRLWPPGLRRRAAHPCPEGVRSVSTFAI